MTKTYELIRLKYKLLWTSKKDIYITFTTKGTIGRRFYSGGRIMLFSPKRFALTWCLMRMCWFGVWCRIIFICCWFQNTLLMTRYQDTHQMTWSHLMSVLSI